MTVWSSRRANFYGPAAETFALIPQGVEGSCPIGSRKLENTPLHFCSLSQ